MRSDRSNILKVHIIILETFLRDNPNNYTVMEFRRKEIPKLEKTFYGDLSFTLINGFPNKKREYKYIVEKLK